MPLYEYRCPSCGTFEVIQKFSDTALTECPKCASAVEKLLSAPAFHLKGSGWYITDYARKGQSEGKGEGEGKGKGGDAKPVESKGDGDAGKPASDSSAKPSPTKSDAASTATSTTSAAS